MPVQTLTPNSVLDAGNWEPSSEADITGNLSDGDNGTAVINTSANQTLILGFSNLTSDDISSISQIVLTIGVYQSGKGQADFTATLELSDGTDVISATSFEVSGAGASNEVTATASSLSLSENNVNGIRIRLDTVNETQAIFTDIKIDVTYSKTSTTGPGGKVQIIYGKVEIQNGKVEL